MPTRRLRAGSGSYYADTNSFDTKLQSGKQLEKPASVALLVVILPVNGEPFLGRDRYSMSPGAKVDAEAPMRPVVGSIKSDQHYSAAAALVAVNLLSL